MSAPTAAVLGPLLHHASRVHVLITNEHGETVGTATADVTALHLADGHTVLVAVDAAGREVRIPIDTTGGPA